MAVIQLIHEIPAYMAHDASRAPSGISDAMQQKSSDNFRPGKSSLAKRSSTGPVPCLTKADTTSRPPIGETGQIPCSFKRMADRAMPSDANAVAVFRALNHSPAPHAARGFIVDGPEIEVVSPMRPTAMPRLPIDPDLRTFQ